MCQVDLLKVYMRCSTPDLPIAIFIQWKPNLQVGLCKNCWERFCDHKKDYEWGNDSRPTLEQIFGRRTKEEAQATLTIYDPTKKGAGRHKAIQQLEIVDENIG